MEEIMYEIELNDHVEEMIVEPIIYETRSIDNFVI